MTDAQTSLTTAQLIAVIAGSGAIVTLLYRSVQALARIWQETLGSRSDWRRRLYKLDQGVTVEYVDGLLGAPMFRAGDPKGHRVATYKTKYALVKAEIDESETVTGYSICATTRLKLDAGKMSFGGIEAKLGKTTFGAVSGLNQFSPPTIRGYLGATRTFYSELYYGARPGAYRSYQIANSWIGFRGGVHGILLEVRDRGPEPGDPGAEGHFSSEEDMQNEVARIKHIQAAAAGFVVNTLAVIGTGGDAKLLEVNMEEFNLWRPSGPVDKVRRDLRRWRVRHQIK